MPGSGLLPYPFYSAGIAAERTPPIKLIGLLVTIKDYILSINLLSLYFGQKAKVISKCPSSWNSVRPKFINPIMFKSTASS